VHAGSVLHLCTPPATNNIASDYLACRDYCGVNVMSSNAIE
jgi:hypothetical protein